MPAISLFALVLFSLPAHAAGPVVVKDYPWLEPEPSAPLARLVRLDDSIQPPTGFERIAVKPGSMGAWLRGLPVRTDRKTVRAYDGAVLRRPAVAIIAMDVGRRDLQQCADSVIRLHAEFLWHRGRAAKAAYHFTSGDRVSFRAWRRGERLKVRGSAVERLPGRARSGSHRSYRRWLDQVFMYAGTRSLARDSRPVPVGQIRPGDFYVEPGGPGHAVLILDVAEAADGRRVALIGQGFMPAEDFHVVGATNALDGVWFPLPQTVGERLDTPSWRPFESGHARRFSIGG